MPPRLTKGQKDELAPQAVDMSAKGMSYRAIGRELELHWKTVDKLIDDELASRAEHRANDVERHLSVYDRAQRAAWELYDSVGDDRAQNKAAAINAVIAAENSKVKLTGAEQAKKHEHSGPDGGPIEHSVSDETNALLDELAFKKAAADGDNTAAD